MKIKKIKNTKVEFDAKKWDETEYAGMASTDCTKYASSKIRLDRITFL